MERRKNKIAAVVVTYNRKDLLRENIEALLAQTEDRFDILIIDNHSTDGTAEAIGDYLIAYERIFYHDTGENLGGAGGFAYGMDIAVEQGYSWVWLMDDDSIPKPDALEALVQGAKLLNGRFGFLSSKALWTDGTPCKMNVQRESLFRNLTNYYEGPMPVVIASFVSMFIPVKIVRKVGLPIAEFFIWTDDWEYSRRISRHFPCYVIPESEVIHKMAENGGTSIATDAEDRLWRYRYAYRNEVYLYRREGIRGLLHLMVRTPVHLARVMLYAKDHRLKRMWLILESTLEGFFFLQQRG